MKENRFDESRRLFFKTLGALGFAALTVPLGPAAAMSEKQYSQGMQKIEGEVKINGRIAGIGDPVKPGDVIATGEKSLAIFVSGDSAYLLRENTRLELKMEGDDQNRGDLLRLLKGGVLGVMGRGRKRFETKTAVVGVRGTGLYLTSEPHRTYLCTCYGEVELMAKAEPKALVRLKTTHHEQPRVIYDSGVERLIEKGPMIDHTDAELILLESLVGRKPPFVKETKGVKKSGPRGNRGGY